MDVSQITQQLSSLKVLLIGEYCYDDYVYGSVDRISPEAPVPVFKRESMARFPGMAGNVYEHLCEYIPKSHIDFYHQRTMIYKERYIESRSNQHMLRVDVGEAEAVDALNMNVLHYQLDNLSQYDAIVISDYDKGFVTPSVADFISNNYYGPLYVDTKKKNVKCFGGAYIKVNEKEESLIESHHESALFIVTLGAAGARYKHRFFPTEKVDMFDASGAGDTFFASFVLAHSCTNNIPRSIEFANRCATESVKHHGTYVVGPGDFNDDLLL